jgi:hypothetical protein
MDQVQAHFPAFRSVGEESAAMATESEIERCHERLFERCAEDDAIYFSRRAREERRLSLTGNCRKCRQTHMELAQAYEFRAHLLTLEAAGRRVPQPLHAL